MDSISAAKAIIKFETFLTIGSEVYALWSRSHHYYCVKAKIARINNKSFTVKLIEAKQDESEVDNSKLRVHYRNLKQRR